MTSPAQTNHPSRGATTRKFPIVPALMACLLVLLGSCSSRGEGPLFSAGDLILGLDGKGRLSELRDKSSRQDYLAEEQPSHLLSIRVKGEVIPPEELLFDEDKGIITLGYLGDIKAAVQAEEKADHLTFELLSLTPEEGVEMVIWGPYANTIDGVIGETIGVVRNENFALGIQSLNPKTLGGFPWNDNDCMPQLDIFESGDFSDLSEEGKRHVLYRVEAAKPESFGSTLQAYCRDRSRERVVENWGHTKYTVPPFADGGVTGSKIALFGCPRDMALYTIGLIEIEEGLPHPTIDGMWGKTAPSASAAYLILDFGETDIQRAIDITKQAGLRYLYHSGPFKTWGHFALNEQFPNGREGLKRCVKEAEAAGLHIGVHTLSNFITTTDPYVTPIPDPRLARTGKAQLTSDISTHQTELPISSPDQFRDSERSHLNTVKIEDELIRFGKVSPSPPWRLLDCRRGAFGTGAAAHKTQTDVSKLADHAYKVFLTDPELSIEVARNIADLFNECGLRQISFDGLEGNRSTGMGNYGEILFTNTWYSNLSEEIRDHFIADASRTSHYFWHIYSRMNWGEPWYAGFRESQTEYRLKNQDYFRRNLMPGMLGWFLMKPETSIEDIEWLLARSAAFDAGYAFVTSYESLEGNGNTDRILEAIGLWEEARMAGAFSDEQKVRMEDIRNEFSLKADGREGWFLTQVFPFTFRHKQADRQPGEPAGTNFSFSNPAEKQLINFILTAEGSDLSDIRFELDSYKEVVIPAVLKKGQSIKYLGGKSALILDRTWKKTGEIPFPEEEFMVDTGEHSMLFNCRLSDREGAAKIEIRLSGRSEPILRK